MIAEKENVTQLINEALSKAVSYGSYRNTMEVLVAEGKSTGIEQTEDLANYTKLNHSRMRRWDRTFKIGNELAEKITALDRDIVFLVLTESWCGDAAQTMPVMNQIAELNPKISFKVVLRDENPELMEEFKYNGTLSIPRLIIFDKTTTEVLGNWGPRPSTATQMVIDYKKEHGNLSPELKQDLQLWYNKDKGKETAEEIVGLL